ncbi:MAG: hypothetical protein ACI35O_16095, partial [Bacillaceae bacterium]
ARKVSGSLKEIAIIVLSGCSMYLVLFVFTIYQSITLVPSYPGEDTFMRGIGLVFAAFICICATIVCFVTFVWNRET